MSHSNFNSKAFLLKHQRFFAIFSIILFAFTWYLDLIHWVKTCPYCRVERMGIGLLGFILLLPADNRPLLRYISYGIAFFAAVTAVNQMFISIKNHSFPTLNFALALCAYIMIGILCIIIHHKLNAPEKWP